MLTASSPIYQHIAQNLALIAVSLFFLPLSTLMLLFCYSLRPFLILRQLPHALNGFLPQLLEHPRRILPLLTAQQSEASTTPPSSKRTVLITGMSMNKALSLSRAFHADGHVVIGADTSPLAFGRVSNTIKHFHVLPDPASSGPASYISSLIHIILKEDIDFWVSCSGVSDEVIDGQARDIILRKTSCKCVQFSSALTEHLHEKDRFVKLCKQLGLAAAVPETYAVQSRDSVHKVLHASQSPTKPSFSSSPPPPSSPTLPSSSSLKQLHQSRRQKKHYILKSTGVNDSTRSDMTLLPRRTPSQTYDHVAALRISKNEPYILQQFVQGKEYCTHSLVVRGEIKAFVACPSSDMLMHYIPISSDDPIRRAMLAFTKHFAARLQDQMVQEGENGEGKGTEDLTGHLSFDFLVSTTSLPDGFSISYNIKCIECNPRPHTAVALFRGREQELARAYLSTLGTPKSSAHHGPQHTAPYHLPKLSDYQSEGVVENGHVVDSTTNPSPSSFTNPSSSDDDLNDSSDPPSDDGIITPLPSSSPVYWISHDLITLFLLPLLALLSTPLRPDPTTLSNLRSSTFTLLYHVLFWQEGALDISDPLPWWWGNHIFWPLKLGSCVAQLVRDGLPSWLPREAREQRQEGPKKGKGKWSRLNVSTGKVFGC